MVSKKTDEFEALGMSKRNKRVIKGEPNEFSLGWKVRTRAQLFDS